MSVLVSSDADITVTTTVKVVAQASRDAEGLLIENRGTVTIKGWLDSRYSGTVGFTLRPGDSLQLTDTEDGDVMSSPLIAYCPVSSSTIHLAQSLPSTRS